ncbi:metal ABC transporter permease, partial [Streptococcus pyogenes]|uniref:metal ABC transporter permease n=1 Tax=Streptococcus pyogenes TaxID=1314 RepID=UPI0011E608B0
DALSHVSLAGVALGVVLGISPSITTIIVVVLAAILLECLRVVYKHYMEISTAILMSLVLALSLIIMSKSHSSSSMSLEQYLFGSIITIRMALVVALFAIAAIILILTVLFIRPLHILTFDEDPAFVVGLTV